MKIKNRKISKKNTFVIIMAEVMALVLIVGVLSMSYANTPEHEEATSVNDVITGVNVGMIRADLKVEESISPLVESAKDEKAILDWQADAVSMITQLGVNCGNNNFKYSVTAYNGSYAAALAGNRLVNCTQFASWGLQAMGILPSGQTIYFKGHSIRGKGAGTITSTDKVTVSYPDATPGSLNLQPGDVCYFGAKKGWGHTMTYAGKDSSGNMMWFSAGGGDVRGKSYGAKYKSNYNGRNVNVLIRINYDKMIED